MMNAAMKPSPLAIALLLATGFQGGALGAAAETCTLNIHVTGLRNQKGDVAGLAFRSSDGWPEDKDKASAGETASIHGSQATVSLQAPPGKYAVVAVHDENQNRKLDRNFLGIPTEGFGFANNPTVFLAAPSFKKAEVNVACPVTNITVKMIYK